MEEPNLNDAFTVELKKFIPILVPHFGREVSVILGKELATHSVVIAMLLSGECSTFSIIVSDEVDDDHLSVSSVSPIGTVRSDCYSFH